MVENVNLPQVEAVPLWFGDLGFVQSSPVDVALLLEDATQPERTVGVPRADLGLR